MIKTSTLFYSIHNLSSNPVQQYILPEDLCGLSQFGDVAEFLNIEKGPVDVRQEVIDKILIWADQSAC